MKAQSSAELAPQSGLGFDVPLSFEACYDKYAGLVTRWVMRLGSSAMDVEDVVQEVFCVVHRKLPQWDGQGTFTTWLFRITHHVLRNWNRKRRISRWLSFGSGDEAKTIEDFHSDEAGPAEQVELKQATQEVRRVLDALAEHHRTLLVLFELEELSTTEIADMLDLKVGTVRVGLHRARAEFLKAYDRMQKRPARRVGRA